jgi:hypothetical protein
MKTLEQDDTDYHRDVETFNQLYKDIRNLRITNNTNTNNNFSSNVSTIDDDIVLTDYSIEVDNNLLDEVFKKRGKRVFMSWIRKSPGIRLIRNL